MRILVKPLTQDNLNCVLLSIYRSRSLEAILKKWIKGSKTPIESMASWGKAVSLVAVDEDKNECLGLLLGYTIPVRAVKAKLGDTEIEEYFKPSSEHEVNKVFTVIHGIYLKPGLDTKRIVAIAKYLMESFIKLSKDMNAEKVYLYLRMKAEDDTVKRNIELFENIIKEFGFTLMGVTKTYLKNL